MIQTSGPSNAFIHEPPEVLLAEYVRSMLVGRGSYHGIFLNPGTTRTSEKLGCILTPTAGARSV